MADQEREVGRAETAVRSSHAGEGSCWEVAWLMLKALAVSIVLGLVIGIILGWGSVVVVQVK